jgi:hypothetical protein
MKGKWVIVSIALLITPIYSNAQLFNQNFNSSSVLSDYFSSTPNTNQFKIISTTNSSSQVAIVNNQLVFTRLGEATTVAYAERNVDFSTSPSALKIQFKFSVSGGSAGTNIFALAVGSDVSNSGTPPTISNLFGRISFNSTSSEGEFKIRDVTNGKNGSNTYIGEQIVVWVLNNSGVSQSYLAPNGEYESIADDKADIWVGTTKEFDEINVDNSTQTLARFKFYTNSSWAVGSTISIDDLKIENESALPVQINSFHGKYINGQVKLDWQTATEINNYGFEIERMEISNQVNASDWQRLGFVQGSGNSNSPKNYTFTDNLLLSNKLIASLQYRLKQMDFDGQFEYSNIVEVIIDKSAQFDLSQNYPNPFNPETTIRFSIPSAEQPLMASLHVYDLLGKLVAVLVNEPKLPGVYEVKFNGSELVSGIYFYKFNVGNFTSVKKLILLK